MSTIITTFYILRDARDILLKDKRISETEQCQDGLVVRAMHKGRPFIIMLRRPNTDDLIDMKNMTFWDEQGNNITDLMEPIRGPYFNFSNNSNLLSLQFINHILNTKFQKVVCKDGNKIARIWEEEEEEEEEDQKPKAA